MPQDHDSDDNVDADTPEDGKGKATSNSVRKAQNRIAQREFRLRKQQYVRDLEARVEVMSSDREERLEIMTAIVRNLMKENRELRDMLKRMAGFIGEGIGSCIPRMGLSTDQLDAILNRADSDSAHEAIMALKAAKQGQKDDSLISLGSPKRRASSAAKRKRSSVPTVAADHNSSDIRTNSPLSVHMDSAVGQHENANQPTPEETQISASPWMNFLFPDLSSFGNNANTIASAGAQASTPARGISGNREMPQSSKYFEQQPQQPAPPQFVGLSPQFRQAVPSQDTSFPWQNQTMNSFPTAFMPTGFGLTLPAALPAGNNPSFGIPSSLAYSSDTDRHEEELAQQRRLREAVADLTSIESKMPSAAALSEQQIAELKEKKERLEKLVASTEIWDGAPRLEAMQLISYHLSNFRVNPSYTLPASLRPTKVQQTIAHELIIDGIIFPSIRDRMILLRGQYDLVDAFQGWLSQLTCHSTDVLSHQNWEISEKWLTDFRMLVDDEVYDICNKWRATRGEPPLRRPVIGESHPSQNQWQHGGREA